MWYYYLLNIVKIKMLSLNFFSTTTWCPFTVSTASSCLCLHYNVTTSCFLHYKKDIVETGRTMQTLLSLLSECNPKMVKVVR